MKVKKNPWNLEIKTLESQQHYITASSFSFKKDSLISLQLFSMSSLFFHVWSCSFALINKTVIFSLFLQRDSTRPKRNVYKQHFALVVSLEYKNLWTVRGETFSTKLLSSQLHKLRQKCWEPLILLKCLFSLLIKIYFVKLFIPITKSFAIFTMVSKRFSRISFLYSKDTWNFIRVFTFMRFWWMLQHMLRVCLSASYS